MAFRPKGYGYTAEIRHKMDMKYDSEWELEAVEWICSHLQSDIPNPKPSGKDAVHEWLKDGVVLCTLMNSLQPKFIGKINQSRTAFKQMENIGNFLSACERLGMNKVDLFQTVDLYEGTNMPQVIGGILALGRKAHSLGKHGVGPREASANKRNFSDDQLREGQNIIGMQMGSFKGATQSGQCFGKPRHIVDKRNFSDDQLREGQNIIGLQMGSNKGASQAGQSFGRPRHIVERCLQ